MYRHMWKRSLIETMDTRLSEPASTIGANDIRHSLNENGGGELEALSKWEHGKLRISGRFLHAMEQLVGPRNKGGSGHPGYYVYTPFIIDEPSNGDINKETAEPVMVMVNRGWIPEKYVDQAKRRQMHAAALPEGRYGVFGMLRQCKYYQPSEFGLGWMLNPVRRNDSDEDTSSRGALVNYYKPAESDTKGGDSGAVNSFWLWVDLEKMATLVREQLDAFGKVLGIPRQPRILKTYFIEEVLDMGDDNNDGSAGGYKDDLINEMMKWHYDEQTYEKDMNMPAVLSNIRSLHSVQSDPKMFYGKPIIGPPQLNVPDKHLGYVYTWYSLGAVLSAMIYFVRMLRVKPVYLARKRNAPKQ